jgi:hypothetical protein
MRLVCMGFSAPDYRMCTYSVIKALEPMQTPCILSAQAADALQIVATQSRVIERNYKSQLAGLQAGTGSSNLF